MSITLLLLNIYLFSAALLDGFFSIYSLSKRNSIIIKIFSASCMSISFYLFGYLLEINSHSLGQMVFWNQIQYIGIPFYPAFWLLLSCIYTKKIKNINNRVLISALIVPVLTFLIRATNPVHHLYYKNLTIKTLLGFNYLTFDKGIFYLIYSVYLIISVILTTSSYIRSYFQCHPYERSGHIIMIIASLLPSFGLLLILINPFHIGLDYAILLLPISLLLMLISLFKYNFLELKTLARETLFDKNADAMLLIDYNNKLVDYNIAAGEILKKSNYDKSIDDLFTNNIGFINDLTTNKRKDIKLRINDDFEYFEIKSVAIEDNTYRDVGHLITLVNITERKKVQEELILLAATDSLTNLYNRRKFMQLGNSEIEHCSEYNTTFSILMLDIDHFKNINDIYGHIAGDVVLKFLSAKMKASFSKTGIIGRLGGEEFAIILPNTNIDNAKNMAEIFRSDISNSLVPYENIFIKFTISIGICQHNPCIKELHELLKYADEALYHSKSNGRNKVTVKSL